MTGTYYYDYINQKDRIDQKQFGQTMSEIQDFTTMLQYQFNSAQCQCTRMTEPMQPANVPFGSSFAGTTVIDNKAVNIWEVADPIMQSAGLSMEFYVDSSAEVVRINTTIASPMGAQTTLMDLSNYQLGEPAASYFVPPKYCHCPTTPTPVVGTCPGNPGTECQCAQSSQLSFCAGVNYPVTLALDIATMDAFVAQAYKTLMLAIPNPTSQCQLSFKEFLCAFYFPSCATVNNVPFTFLPCLDLCPDCGIYYTGNCTAAPVDALCTAYVV